jgi:hypothetical protein
MGSKFFYVATVDTRNYTFTAYGKTKREAMTALRNVFKIHAERTGAWLTWSEIKSDVNIQFLAIGKGYVN